MSNRSTEKSLKTLQHYDRVSDSDDMQEVCVYFCRNCQLPIHLKRSDPVMCTNPKKDKPGEICYTTDLYKLERSGYLFRVCR